MALSSFADGSLFGTRFGTAPPRVVALHGWGRSHQDFASSLEGLDAVSIDLPGFGVSPAPSEVGGASMYANLVAPILDICNTPVILVGHSFGGRVAVVRQHNIDVLIVERSLFFVGQQVFASHGCDPAEYRIVVVKSPNGFRPYYDSIAPAICAVDVVGSTSANLPSLPYKKVARPIFPLDDVQLEL